MARTKSFLALLAALIVVGSAVAATDGPVVRLNARDQELARTVALRAGDLPVTFRGGYVKASVTPVRCVGFAPAQSDLVVSGYVGSSFVDPSKTIVGSTAKVFADPAQVAKDWARTVKPALAHCLGLTAARTLRGTLRSARRIASPKVEPKTAAFRIVVVIGGRVETQDVILFAEGRIEAALTLRARPGTLPPAQLEQLTAGLIATRFD